MTIQAEFEQLEMSEKIRVVQQLWDQIAASPEKVPIPKWHQAELEKRDRERSETGEQSELWDTVEKRLRASI